MIECPPMRLRVDLLPKNNYEDLVILVDVLRASTSIVMLLAHGAREVVVARTAKIALATREEGDILLGEHQGMPLEGFYHGTSPAELTQIKGEGRRILYVSDNLPRALSRIGRPQHLLLGTFRNAGAVTRAALSLAEREIAIACAGHARAEALDDTLAAGFLAKRLVRSLGLRTDLQDATRLSMALLKAFPDPQEALWQSAAGQLLRRLGFTEDLALATLISQDTVVPRLQDDSGEAPNLFTFKPWNA